MSLSSSASPRRTASPRALPISMVVLTILASGAFLSSPSSRADHHESKLSERLFELRTYHCHDGKLAHLHQRFRGHTNALFVKHGMSLIAYWTPEDAKDTLVYVLAYPNREAREKAWKGFLNDSVWKEAFRKSREKGPLVKKVDSRFLRPTDYSPIR